MLGFGRLGQAHHDGFADLSEVHDLVESAQTACGHYHHDRDAEGIRKCIL